MNNLLGSGTSFFPPPLIPGLNVFYAAEINAGCEGPASVVVLTVDSIQTAIINYPGNVFCQSTGSIMPVISGVLGGTFSSLPAGLVIDPSSGEIDAPQSLLNTYQVTYTPAGPCAISSTVQISITASPNANFFYDSPYYCVPSPDPVAQLAPGAGYGVFSSIPPGLVFSNPANGTIDVSLSNYGTYVITHVVPQSGNCAADTATFTVIISSQSLARIEYGSPYYCSGKEGVAFVNLVGDRNGTFSVSPPGLSLLDNNGTIDLEFSLPGNYTVTYNIPAALGCPAVNAVASVTINETPVVTVSPTQTIKEGASVELTAQGSGSLIWSNGESLSTIIVSPVETSNYCVSLTSNGCVDTACTQVIVELDCDDIFIPGGFSPNDDGNNDIFRVRMKTQCLSTSVLRVYDRWGALLFESNDINLGWNGTYRGELLSNGVYTYSFEYKLRDSDFLEVKNGSIQLLR